MKKSVSSSASVISERDKTKLSSLLNKYLGENQQLLVQKTEMGGTQAYVGSVTLEWFAQRVHFASFLPLLRSKYNPDTDNIEIDAASIDDIQQRPLDWSRQAPLVQYLAARKNHKFPPILAVINQPWVEKNKAPEWDRKKRAKKSTTDFTPLDDDGEFGLLDIDADNVTIYALDGQHRLMAVQGLMEITTKRIFGGTIQLQMNGRRLLVLEEIKDVMLPHFP